MRTVGAEQTDETGEDPVVASSSKRLVLPPFLRRYARRIERIHWRLPRHFGVKASAAFLLASVATGVVVGGHVGTIATAITAWSGLAIDEVKITGQSETSELDILDRLGLGDLASLATFDVDGARDRIQALPWVKQATIVKLYPDAMQVVVSERSPFALWQHGSVVSLIDDAGSVISDYVDERYTRLPMVVGEGAGKRVKEFTDLVAGFSDLEGKVKAGVLVSQRRWNLVLNDGVEIMLPEEGAAGALAQVVALDEQHGLLGRDIVAVDMRVRDRLVVRLTERANAARQAMLKEREKMARRARTNT